MNERIDDTFQYRPHIQDVRPVVDPWTRRTPVIELGAEDLGLEPDTRITLKLEQLQHSGSFKVRGAFANLLLRDVPETGVVAASGGNHGAAVAYAAMRLGVRAKIFVPEIAAPAKLARIREYGADLVVGGARYADALAESQRWVATSGAMAVHAYDQHETILGQGTLAAELEAQTPDLDTVLVAVGGGGLIGGVAAWYRPGAHGAPRIVGVEPERAPTLTRAMEAGEPVDAEAGGIAADSLAPRRVGDLPFQIARSHVRDVVLVSEDSIQSAQRTLWKALRVVAEPGGAAALAALLSGAYRPRPSEHVGIVICGGNTNAAAVVDPS